MCSQKILIVSHHSFLDEQIRGLKKIHGKNVKIHNESTRFRKIILRGKKRVVVDDYESLQEFHLAKTIAEGYDMIYYVLPQKMQTLLLKDNLSFGVLERPKRKNFALELTIVHRISLEQTQEKFKRRLARNGNLGYQNRSDIKKKK